MKLTESAAEKGLKARAIPGMAHFAGTGPAGATCGGCVHFQPRQVLRGDISMETGEGACTEAKRLTGAKKPPLIQHRNPACKYFTKPE